MPDFGYLIPAEFASGSLYIALHPVMGPGDLRPESIGAASFNYGGIAKDSSIVLPNGSIYDPYQTYDAPVVHGIIQGRFHLLPAFNATDQQIANGIDRQLEIIYAMVGQRGRLRVLTQRPPSINETALDCIARMIELKISSGPPHDTYGAGPINKSPAFDITWRQVGDWVPFTL